MFCFTPKGKLIALPRKAQRRSISPTRFTPTSAKRGRCKINGKIAPLVSSCRTATRSRSSPPRRRRRRRRHGSRSSSPARRAPRSAARPGSRCATQYAGLGTADGRAAVPSRQAGLFGRAADGRAAAARARKPRGRIRGRRPWRDEGCGRRPGDVSRTTRRNGCRVATPKTDTGWFGLLKAKAVVFKVPERPPARSRSAASTATCRCASHPTAARCRAIASSAS